MRPVILLGVLIGLATLCGFAMPAVAQGIDCGKARTAQEKAICGSPGLMALDHQVAVAYANAVARDPARAAQLRQGLLAWLRQRDAACGQPDGMTDCLTRQLTDRLAALTPQDASPAASPPAIPSAAPAAAAPVTDKTTTPRPVAVPAEPAVPSEFNPPMAAGRLDAASLPASEENETLLHVSSPGRFTIAVHSPGGAALQLVDMQTGPSDIAGAAGTSDGRLDQLLDVGTYKLRVFSAKAATGMVALSLTAFHDAKPPAALPQPGQLISASLADSEQRGFWLTVPDLAGGGDNVRIEAAGRALADLRLWRDGRELADLTPEQRRIEPVSGHQMTDLRLVRHVEPGTYLVIAYGGLGLPWTDNDPAQPFYLRAGASGALAEGWASGVVGPFGSEVFAWPAVRGTLRLDLPAAAAASLTAGEEIEEISAKSRSPSVRLGIPNKGDGVVELRAAAGQAYTLRMIGLPAPNQLTQPGTYFVTAVTSGLGGDEPPPSVLLQRFDSPGPVPKPAAIVASVLPEIGADGGWHARFNLHGETGLLFQSGSGGEMAVRVSGMDVTTQRDRIRVADLPPGYFVLDITPKPGLEGILDLIVGKPGQTPPLQAALPPDPALPLGVQTLTRGQRLTLTGSWGPNIAVGLAARPVPVALVEGPLTVTLAQGAALSVPVRVAPGGRLAVAEVGVGDIPFDRADGPGQVTVAVPAAGHPRTVVLSWRREPVAPAPIAPPRPADRTLAVQAGTPAFFDLARGETRGFTLMVPDGGLYRIETLGRLHTSGRLATPFIASLDHADANGTGQNMLLQSMLRAGRFRVDVTAVDSTGHLGLLASPAPLLAGAALLPGGSVRASLPAGSGVAFPVEIADQAPRYRLNVDGLGAPWTGRLEDNEGWPITTPGPLDGIETAARPGHYRLVVAPDAVMRQVVARLTPLTTPVEIVGHGPHALPFEATKTATWREPDLRDQPRVPDDWRFALAGPAEATLRLGEGMVGELRRGDALVARIVGTFQGRLEAGDYVLAATSLGRNDRLGYTVRLDTREVQPGTVRDMTLPADVAFAIAQARVVSLTTTGTTPVRAELRREDGSVIARYGAREDDWNIAVSRLLPAGRYHLWLTAATAPQGGAVETPPLPVYAAIPSQPPDAEDQSDAQPSEQMDKDDSDDDSPTPRLTDGQAAQTGATQGASESHAKSQPASRADADTDTDADNESGKDDAPKPKVALRLALPESLPEAPAPATDTVLAGQGVHVLRLAQPVAGSLVVAQALSPASLVLALERQDASGWQTVAIDEGRGPMVASPADTDPRPWRVEVWTVDGGPEPVHLAVRTVAMVAQAAGTVALAAQDSMPGPLAVARVKAGASGPMAVSGGPAGLLAGGWAGHRLAPIDGGTVMLPGDQAWLVARAAGPVSVRPLAFPVDTSVSLSLPEEMAAPLPAVVAAAGHVALWRADSGLGQPGLGGEMGVAASSALAMARDGVVLRNAGDAEALRLRLTRLEPSLAPERTPTAPLHLVLPPGGAVPVSLSAGDKRLAFDLAADTAAIAGWKTAHSLVTWGGAAALSRDTAGTWTDVLLVNTGPRPAPVSLSWQPEPPAQPLRPGSMIKRFFGAAGSFEMALDAPSGSRLGVAGTAGLTVTSADGLVRRGRTVTLDGPGRVSVRHGVGPMAVWVETDTQSPWPAVAVQAVQAPLHLALSGPAMALGLHQDNPVLLHATTTAPVLIGLKQAGRTDPPALFADGAALHRVVAAGPAELRIYPPQDGPLTGSLELAAEPIVPIQEGLGEPVTVAPGGTAVFGFSLSKKATIGVGVRADPDRVGVKLLDGAGSVVGEGVAQLRTLPAGAYMIEAQVAPDAPPSTLRPAVVGITPRGNGPPPDVVAGYLALVGMKLQEGTK